ELARVGRLVTRKTVALKTADGPDPGRWNRYYLDLEQHVNAEPGAIYRVELSFGQQHSVYPCEAATVPDAVAEKSWEEEQAQYDRIQDYWYYDDYEDYWYDEEEQGDQNDPCSPA